MRIRKKTVLNILLIAFILSFFVTPLGDYCKVLLNRLFSFSPEIVAPDNRHRIADYDWKLKDANWAYFNFRQSEGKVVFINFWASWRLPCAAELQSIQELYNRYKEQVDFYIITDEQRVPVREFISEHHFTFPVTYLIIGEKAPVAVQDPPRSYIIDKDGYIVVKKKGIADWDNSRVYGLMDSLLLTE